MLQTVKVKYLMKLQPVISRKADLMPPAEPILQGEILVKSQKMRVCCFLLYAISKTLQERTSFLPTLQENKKRVHKYRAKSWKSQQILNFKQ